MPTPTGTGTLADPFIIDAAGDWTSLPLTNLGGGSTTAYWAKLDFATDDIVWGEIRDLTSGATGNVQFNVRQGTLPSPSSVGFSQAGSSISIRKTSADLYLLWNWLSTPNDSTFTLRVDVLTETAPSDHVISAATDIDIDVEDDLSINLSGADSIYGSTVSYEDPPASSQFISWQGSWRSRYFRIVPTTTRFVHFSLTGTSGRIRLDIRAVGSGSNLLNLIYPDEWDVELTAGTIYYLRVYEDLTVDKSDSAFRTTTLTWTFPHGLAYNDPLVVSDAAPSYIDVVYPGAGFRYIRVEGLDEDIHQIWVTDTSGAAGPNYSVVASTSSDITGASQHTVAEWDSTGPVGGEVLMRSGDTYLYLRVYGYVAGTLRINYRERPAETPPANDTFDNAIDITTLANPFAWDNTGAYGSAWEQADNDSGNPVWDGERSIWYSLTLTDPKIVRFEIDAPARVYYEVIQDDGDNSWGTNWVGVISGFIGEAGHTYYLRISQPPVWNDTPDGWDYKSGTMAWAVQDVPPNVTPETAIPLPQRLTPDINTGDPSSNLSIYYTVVAPKDGVFNITTLGTVPGGDDGYQGYRITNVTTGAVGDWVYTYEGVSNFGSMVVSAGDELLIEVDVWNAGEIAWGIESYDNFTWSDWYPSSRDEVNTTGDTPAQAYGVAEDGGGAPGDRGYVYGAGLGGNHSQWTDVPVFHDSGAVRDAAVDMPIAIDAMNDADHPNGAGGSFLVQDTGVGAATWGVFGSGSGPGWDWTQRLSKYETRMGSHAPLSNALGGGEYMPPDHANHWPAISKRALNGLDDLIDGGDPFHGDNFITLDGGAHYIHTGPFLYQSSVTGVTSSTGGTKPYHHRLWFRITSWSVNHRPDATVQLDVHITGQLLSGLSVEDTDATDDIWPHDQGGTGLFVVNNPADGTSDAMDWTVLFSDFDTGLGIDPDRSDTNYVIGAWIEDSDELIVYQDILDNLSGVFGTAAWDVNYSATPSMEAREGYFFPGNYRYGYQTTPNLDLIGKLKVRLTDNTWRIVGNPAGSDTERLKIQTPDLTWWKEYRTTDGDVPTHPLKLYTDTGWVIVGQWTPE
jgi:hypothetical protein